jgi:hypothetical protein
MANPTVDLIGNGFMIGSFDRIGCETLGIETDGNSLVIANRMPAVGVTAGLVKKPDSPQNSREGKPHPRPDRHFFVQSAIRDCSSTRGATAFQRHHR